ncbi:uncharacterized protein LOC113510470 isoform X1 [Galleria mellonella]|uniref:Uncharacterized protein LOC113510470 isoform X1 n=1 Tax=Galleria mellonella TaxID=7137 RepID=A0ABM3MF00_GALME|nr:uncharacterized protein LOC113510470 isoform X1 [Galleria mellonella]
MSRRDGRLERPEYPITPLPPPSKCAKVLYYTWKLCSVVFSHFVMISLVVAYCILGAVTFERLEAQHEREVKMNISQIRSNTTQSIWLMTRNVPLLNQTNWTSDVVDMLKDFENAILLEMKVRGWDGNESTDHIQWTFTGALFYSIIVITTIGYGHIAPKTQTGKVVTIFYAILGIPLMLLCLANIGDVMASSFRFLYWRVCCYVCTRPPKKKHRHHHASMRRSIRTGSGRGSTRRRRPLERAHSDTDCRYRDSGYSSGRARRPRQPPAPPPPAARTARSQPPLSTHTRGYGTREYDREDCSPVRYEKYARDQYDDDEEGFPKISLPLQDLEAALKDLDNHQMKITSKSELRSKSLPRPAKSKPDYGPRRDFDDNGHYDIDNSKDMYEMHDLHDVDYENYKERKALEERERRRKEHDGYNYRDRAYDPEDEDFEFDAPRSKRVRHDWRAERGRSEYYERDREDLADDRRRGRRARSAIYDYEHRWADDRDRDVETGRGRRLRRLYTVDDTARLSYRYSPSPDRDDWSDEVVVSPKRHRHQAWGSRQSEIYPFPPEVPAKEEIKPVPIWLCVFLVASYIVAGTFLFKRWEGWAYLDAAYFCFITLTTIGFGDFVPAQGQSVEDPAAAVHSIALCSLYLLFGIALLAMSFNLVQEEVRANVASLATKLGIIKPRDQHNDTDTDY